MRFVQFRKPYQPHKAILHLDSDQHKEALISFKYSKNEISKWKHVLS